MTAMKEARNVSRLTDVNLAMEMNANATIPGRIAFWYHLILILSNLYWLRRFLGAHDKSGTESD